jgi:hypothetical protein
MDLDRQLCAQRPELDRLDPLQTQLSLWMLVKDRHCTAKKVLPHRHLAIGRFFITNSQSSNLAVGDCGRNLLDWRSLDVGSYGLIGIFFSVMEDCGRPAGNNR